MRNSYPTEDDYFTALYDAHDEAEKEARESAEMAADLYEWESEKEREDYVEEYFAREYEALCAEYERGLAPSSGRDHW